MTRAQHTRHHRHGFSLPELLVVLLIGVTLVALAVAGYVEHARRSHRAKAQIALMEAEHLLHRHHAAHLSFAGAQLPPALAQVPAQGPAVYRLELSTAGKPPQRFSLRAVRTGTMKGDRCGDLAVDQTGRRTISNNAPDTTLNDCFKAS